MTITIQSEVKRWLDICKGTPPVNDPNTWDFYNSDIILLASQLLEAERDVALTEARKQLNLTKPIPVLCKDCNDAGWIVSVNPKDGREYKYKCPKCKGHPDTDLLFQQANIPPLFLPYRKFKTYNEPTLQAASDAVAKFIRRYRPGRGLLLMGAVGVGKTHLAIGVIKALSKKKVQCRFWDINEWLDQLRKSYNDMEDSAQLLTAVKEAEVLVFDDLGAQRVTDHTTDRLFDVLNFRYLNKLSTIITTNISEKRIVDTYGQRLWSRLSEMCERVEVKSVDHRTRTTDSQSMGEPRDWYQE